MSYLQSSVILNKSNNFTPTTNNNKITLKLGVGAELRNNEVCLSSLYIYYSWYNVTSVFANRTLSYTWHDDTEHSITIPEGFYTVTQLNEYLEFEMFSNGHYLLDSNGDPVYYLNFVTNSVYYGVTLTSTPVPIALPSGFTNPASMTFPVTAKTPLLNIPAFTDNGNKGFGLLIGFSAGSYPSTAQTTTYQVNNDLVPVIHPVNNVIVKCNLCDNSRYNTQDHVIKQFTPNSTFGTQLRIEPQNYVWYHVIDGIYDKIEISFFDDSYRPLIILDNNIQVELQIREKINIPHYK